MKFLAFILSIYILTLNLAPCEDYTVLDDEVKIEISQQSLGDHTDLDLCSPFCQCHCCHIHATYLSKVDCAIASIDISTKLFFHFNGLEKDFTTSILQPPRV